MAFGLSPTARRAVRHCRSVLRTESVYDYRSVLQADGVYECRSVLRTESEDVFTWFPEPRAYNRWTALYLLSGVGGLDGAFVATRQGTDVDGSGRDHGAAGDERGVLGSANEETAGQVAFAGKLLCHSQRSV